MNNIVNLAESFRKLVMKDKLFVCPKCDGSGEKEETRGGDGDPEYDVPVVCDLCEGEKFVPKEVRDDYEEEREYEKNAAPYWEKYYSEQTDPRQQAWE